MVIKKSNISTDILLKTHFVAENLANLWNIQDTDSDKEIKFLEVASAEIKIDGKKESVTIEEYINRVTYTKW